MDDIEFVFATSAFPPDAASAPAVAEIVKCIVSLTAPPVLPSNPFIVFASALPQPRTANDSLSESEITHAKAVLKAYPAFAEARRQLVPRFITDEKLWSGYFCLLSVEVRAAYHRNMEDPDEAATTRILLRQPNPGRPTAAAAVNAVREQQDNSGEVNSSTSRFEQFLSRLLDDALLDPPPASKTPAGPTTTLTSLDEGSIKSVADGGVLLPASLTLRARAGNPAWNTAAGASVISIFAKDSADPFVRKAWRKSLNDMSSIQMPKF